MEECEENHLKETNDHNSTKDDMDEFKGTCIRALAEMSSKLETATVQGKHYQELLTEHGLGSLLETRPRSKRHYALTRKRSNSDAPSASHKVAIIM